jgi:predicted porin
MNKKLISIAVGAALAAGTVVAQAADDDAMPKVYGKVHVSYGAVKDDYKYEDPNATEATPTQTPADNIQFRSHASRIGVKGAVPISDSLKGTYGLEWGLDVGSSNTFSNRNQYAGLKGGFGEFRFGRHDTPTKMAQGKFDEFNDTDGDIVGALKMSRGDLRLNNVIAYLSPDFSGFTFAAAVAPGEGNGCQSSTNADSDPACNANKPGSSFGGDGPADIISLAGTYKMAGLMVSLGFDQYDKKANPTDFPADIGDVPDFLDGAKAGGDYKDLMRLVATYKMDMFGVGALYETSSGNKDNFGGDKDVMGISGHVSLAGGHKIKLQYLTGETDFNAPDDQNNALKIGKNEETQISVGYDFKMGKATTAYAIYTQGEDKTSIDAQYGGESLKREYSFIGVGMIQNF